MKNCLLCGEPSPDDTATCPNDGEASWSEPLPEPEPPAPEPPTPEPKVSFGGKRK